MHFTKAGGLDLECVDACLSVNGLCRSLIQWVINLKGLYLEPLSMAERHYQS